MTLKELETRLRTGFGRRREPVTIELYCQALYKLYQVTHKTEWNRHDLLSYFDGMIDKGFAPTTIQTYYYSLKSIFRVLDIPFDLKDDDLPRGQVRATNRPVVTNGNLEHLIEWTKEYGDAQEQLFLCLSSVYGLRRIELSRLADASFLGETFHVDTAKHGIPREHYIPDEISEYIEPALGHKLLPVPVTTLSRIWNRLCEKAGYLTKDREGWHSVRRALVGELIKAGVPEIKVLEFMRWSAGRSMVARYAAANDLVAADKEIFKHHRYLDIWRK